VAPPSHICIHTDPSDDDQQQQCDISQLNGIILYDDNIIECEQNDDDDSYLCSFDDSLLLFNCSIDDDNEFDIICKHYDDNNINCINEVIFISQFDDYDNDCDCISYAMLCFDNECDNSQQLFFESSGCCKCVCVCFIYAVIFTTHIHIHIQHHTHIHTRTHTHMHTRMHTQQKFVDHVFSPNILELQIH